MKRPFVTANFAITADGRISTRNRTPADFSSPHDKRRFLEIRAACDAVLAGARTITADRMTMGMPAADLRAARKTAGKPEYPLRVLVSNSGRFSPDLPIFQKPFSPILIFTTGRMSRSIREALLIRGDLYVSSGSTVELEPMLRILYTEHGVRRLICEGGAALFRSLLSEDLIDELHLTLAPRVFGGRAAPAITGPAGEYLARSTRLRMRHFEVVENECYLRYSVAR